ncbi:hypothetical protein AS033_14330 [Exiguobacterium indicum]|uniref:Uncharacterized protein n=2 Tax=Exiguobacterium indicum TaxID=296995 RepID=A0A0V8GC87_9BACL|nr:hypothetical protein AS033_14330 [Exiguobacterium enclense]SDD28440.1 hypothetical protein SAMN05216342_2918 [Exiguobacterium enclense]
MIRLSFRLLMTNWIFLMLYQHLPSSPRVMPETDAGYYSGVFETLLSFMIVITVGGILTDAIRYFRFRTRLLSFTSHLFLNQGIALLIGGILLIVFNGLFQPLYFQAIASSAAFLYFLMTRLTLLYKNDSAV